MKIGWEKMDWIDLAPGIDKWRFPALPPSSIKCREFSDQLRNYQLLKNSFPRS
jgi:hypothetical protein